MVCSPQSGSRKTCFQNGRKAEACSFFLFLIFCQKKRHSLLVKSALWYTPRSACPTSIQGHHPLASPIALEIEQQRVVSVFVEEGGTLQHGHAIARSEKTRPVEGGRDESEPAFGSLLGSFLSAPAFRAEKKKRGI
jgi:hypothetical protein